MDSDEDFIKAERKRDREIRELRAPENIGKWNGVLPADDWYAIETDTDADADRLWDVGEEPEWVVVHKLIAWAWITCEYEGSEWDALVGIVTNPPPNFENPPGPAGEDWFYVHKSELTSANLEKWVQRTKERAELEKAEHSQ